MNRGPALDFIVRHIYVNLCEVAQTETLPHTNHFHWIHMVHKVSLSQVQGNLREAEKNRPRLQDCYFWELEELHINFTPPYPQRVPCNDYITEATYMPIATGLLENPGKRENRKR